MTARSEAKEDQGHRLVIEATGVSKRYCRDLKRSLFYGLKDVAREIVGRKKKNLELREGEFWALQNVDLTLRQGESLGLIGRNGCGKTTLMRIISGLIKPTHGEITVNGRLAPLLALGAGFNPVLTGRENIYVNMAVLGLTKAEIEERFDDVVAFSEIGYALDAPVQTYSSGMTARLGFSCAIHTAPDVLLLDEVFAVGDLQFRQKCFARLRELRRVGTSFILVSHMPSIILGLCNRGVYLREGEFVMAGEPTEVIDRYEEDLHIGGRGRPDAVVQGADLEGGAGETRAFEILAVAFRDSNNVEQETVVTPLPARLVLDVRVNEPVKDFHAVITFMRMASTNPDDFEEPVADEEGVVLQFANHLTKTLYDLTPGKYQFGVKMRKVGLRSGLYRCRIEVFASPNLVLATFDGFRFLVKTKVQMEGCQFYQPHQWFVEAADEEATVKTVRKRGAATPGAANLSKSDEERSEKRSKRKNRLAAADEARAKVEKRL